MADVGHDVRHHQHGELGAQPGLESASTARMARHMAAGVGSGLSDRDAGDACGQAHYAEAGAAIVIFLLQACFLPISLAPFPKC